MTAVKRGSSSATAVQWRGRGERSAAEEKRKEEGRKRKRGNGVGGILYTWESVNHSCTRRHNHLLVSPYYRHSSMAVFSFSLFFLVAEQQVIGVLGTYGVPAKVWRSHWFGGIS